MPAGHVYGHPVFQMDLHATALAPAGIKEEQGLTLDGVDLVPYVTGGENGPLHEALYWRFGPQMAIRAGNGRES